MAHSRNEQASEFTLGDVIAAVMDVSADERQGAAVLAAMLRSGSVRLAAWRDRRASASESTAFCYPQPMPDTREEPAADARAKRTRGAKRRPHGSGAGVPPPGSAW